MMSSAIGQKTGSWHQTMDCVRKLADGGGNRWLVDRGGGRSRLDIGRIARAEVFAMHLEHPHAEDAMVAAGVALAADVPSIYAVPKREELPFFLRQADKAYPHQITIVEGGASRPVRGKRSSREVLDSLRTAPHQDTFIGCIMSGLSHEQYAEGRSHLQAIDGALHQMGSAKNFCEGIAVATPSSYDSPKDSLSTDLGGVKGSDACVFYVYDTEKRPSSLWVELGAALQWGKPCTLLTPNLDVLPPSLLKTQFANLRIVQYGTHEQFLQKLHDSPTTLLAAP